MTDVVNESFNSDPYLDVETLDEFETILSSPEEGVEQAPAESPNKPQENESSKEEKKVDIAIRFSKVIDDFDIGI